MTHTRLELCNMIRMEAEHTEDTGFPLEVFPQTVQSVILDMARYENYKTEFIATAMISAISAALGGTYRIRIKGEWQSNAALYIILVGRPGLGKTPPLEAAYRPIRKHDYALFKAYESELEAWKAAGENGKKPVLRRTVVSDFTPESLLLTHNNNPRSVVILVDEIMGMFNSANRYTNGQLIEQLLTAWSGGALDVTRVSSTIPVHIEQPCINIIGTTQTKRVHELLTKGFEENGLLDRILFVLPKSREVSKWTDWDDGGEDRASLAAARWEQILGKVLALDYDTGEEGISHVLSMDKEAKEFFFSWWNRKVERINRIEDDAEVDSREMKHPAQVARLTLLMQVLRYASGESHLQFVDLASVKAAVRLNGYFEDSYRRIRSFVAEDMCEEPPKVLLSLLPDTFDTKTAIATGREQQNVSERTVMNYLKELCRSGLLRKAKAGHYEKVIYDKSGISNENDNEPPTRNCNGCPLVAACSLCSFAVSECRKGKIPARLQELQTANGGFHLQESTKESIMNGYRFHLQKYRPGSKTACPECGRKSCFTRYIDEAGEIFFPDNVGICDHINSCGYHYTPKEYFRDNPTVKERLSEQERNSRTPTAARPTAKPVPEQEPRISFLPSDWVEQSMRRYDINPLHRYFIRVMGKKDTDRLFRLYRVGTSRMWKGAAVFWQTDRNGNVRAGKIMGYDVETGHRIKEPFNHVSWVHSARKIPDFRMKQCLFGEHLLSDTSAAMSAKPVAIVESEKTALVAAHFIPDFVWLATGGMHGCFSGEAMQVLDGREVILFPDLKATEEWRQRLPMLESFCRRATCSDLLERIATNEQRSQGLDIADFLLMEDTPQMILARMIERNPVLQIFIDTFGLELVDAGRVE